MNTLILFTSIMETIIPWTNLFAEIACCNKSFSWYKEKLEINKLLKKARKLPKWRNKQLFRSPSYIRHTSIIFYVVPKFELPPPPPPKNDLCAPLLKNTTGLSYFHYNCGSRTFDHAQIRVWNILHFIFISTNRNCSEQWTVLIKIGNLRELLPKEHTLYGIWSVTYLFWF